MKNIVVLDGYNLMHRARSGFALGDYPVVFNFFRSLRALVEKLNPDRCVFVIEGEPKARLKSFPEYKQNREIDPDDLKKLEEMKSFHRQKDLIIDLLKENFPISVMRHPNYEADDLMYTVIDRGSRAIDYTIVSSDTDFIQMLNSFENVRIYNPVTKSYVNRPDYDYLTWKALKGDSCDNIPGIPGIGEVTATDLAMNPEKLEECLSSEEKAERFSKNFDLIKLHSISTEELMLTESSVPRKNWSRVFDEFEKYGFKSMVKESYKIKFIKTFDKLWGTK